MIDTMRKRMSAISPGLVFLRTPPLPDGSIDRLDRAHLLGLYIGVLDSVTSATMNGRWDQVVKAHTSQGSIHTEGTDPHRVTTQGRQ